MSILLANNSGFSIKNIYSDDFSSNISLFTILFSKFAPELNKLKNGEFESTKSRFS